LLGNPYHYRDQRTDGMLEVAFAKVPRANIFAQTGIQFMAINTLYQLLAMAQSHPAVLEIARTFLTIPDLLNYWLTGHKGCEFSNATTTQCYDPQRGTWAYDLLAQPEIPSHFFPELIQPGTPLGPLRPAIADLVGAGPVPVIAP